MPNTENNTNNFSQNPDILMNFLTKQIEEYYHIEENQLTVTKLKFIKFLLDKHKNIIDWTTKIKSNTQEQGTVRDFYKNELCNINYNVVFID